MDVSKLTEKPKGRQPIDTRTMPLERVGEVAQGIGRQIAAGARVYWVCPLIEESEEIDLANVQERFRLLSDRFPGKVGLLHGRLKSAEREATMAAFADGRLSILVATTVIEVGVDVPAATVMVIEHAERFGLAQRPRLHSASVSAYQAALERLLRPRLILRLEQQIQKNIVDPSFVYEALKVYLMLGGKAPKVDIDLIVSWFIQDWEQNMYPGP
eukprot:gene4226-5577_t